MTETISVSVSGSAFALLLYENIKNEYDQDGFLLGNIISKEINKLTDADHRVVHTEHILKIKSVVPCPQQFYFYDSSGKINVDKIKSLLSGQEIDVIGWFLYKRKSGPLIKLNLREKIIHKELANYFRIQAPYFSCCVLTAECSSVKSTYSLCQSFLRYNMCKFESLPLHIVNLSDPCYTFKTTEPASEVFNQIVKSVKGSGDCEGHLVIKKLQDTLQESMKKMVTEANKKEQELFKLEQEIKQLQYNQMLKREYVNKELNLDISRSTEICENGTPEQPDQESSESSQISVIENSVDSSRKRRGQSRKQDLVQNNNGVSSTKNCDMVDDKTNENEIGILKQTRTRPKTNTSYSEAAQKKKN